MKAYTINKYGKTEKLQVTELDVPPIADHQVLVEIHAASINQLDVKIKKGEFKLFMPYKFPLILGHDLAGVVIRAGSKTSRFKPGDEVFARASDFNIGTFAQYIALNENDLAQKPTNISMEEAAAVPLVALTVWQAFVEKAELKSGQKVFIQAGSGGVGTIAIQIAKHLGAVVATTSSALNFPLVKRLGSDVLIDYRTQDFEAILEQYDLVLHSQDNKTLEKSLRILKPGGKVISISGPPDLDFAKKAGVTWPIRTIISLMSRKVRKQAEKLHVDYSFLFMQANGNQLAEIGSLIQSGVVQPVIDKIFPFEQANEALSYVQSGRAKGKVVLKIR